MQRKMTLDLLSLFLAILWPYIIIHMTMRYLFSAQMVIDLLNVIGPLPHFVYTRE